jgi:hypothetical protein
MYKYITYTDIYTHIYIFTDKYKYKCICAFMNIQT